MALSVTCSKISQDGAGRVSVTFNDQTTLEFASKEEAIDWARGLDAANSEAFTLLRRLLAAWWIKQDPTGATPALVVGKTITVNLTTANIVVVS